MNIRPILNAVAAAGLVAFAGAPGPAWADDAEIYVNQRDIPETSQPLVMFSLDYRPNLGSTVCTSGECDFLVKAGVLPEGRTSFTRLEMMRGALRLVMEPLSGVRVGLMMNHRHGPCAAAGPGGARSGCANGGYIAMGFREFQEGDANGAKAMFDSVLATLPVPPPSGGGGGGAPADHSYQGKELFYEFYRYLAGDPVYNGKNGFTSFDAVTGGSDSINVVPEYVDLWRDTPSEEVNGFAWDPTIIEGAVVADETSGTYTDVGRYKSPLIGVGDCSKIFTVNFLFQVSNQESDSDAEILPDIGVRNGTGLAREFAPMIEYLNRTDLSPGTEGDQKVTSYFLGPDPQYRNTTFARYAQAGGSGSALELSDDPMKLVATLTDMFQQILSVSTTFTAAALPVNSFDRSQLLSDVFLGLFQPQVDDYPQNNSYWWGNVKKLRLAGLGDDEEAVQLVDANDDPAVAADGRIRYIAQTLWTDPSGADVLDAGRDPDENAVAGFDGRSVNRGGSGHKTPGFPRHLNYNPQRRNPASLPEPPGPRRLLYDGAAGLAPLEATDTLASNAALQAAIGGNAAETLEVLKFMRGLDPIAEEPDVLPLEWMFGSVIHSRPLPVNYGARDGHGPGNPLIYIAAGGNDGALRFIRNTDSSGAQLGQESWAFIPTEVMGNVRRMVRQEGPQFSGDSTIYGFDGPPTLYIEDLNSDGTIDHTAGDKAILYAGLRRGGRAYYALDVSNPENPTLLWRIVGGETAGFENLGWTFSQPRVGKINISGTVTPVVIFGGGFDRAYDNPTAGVTGPLGRGIYVVNAETGGLIRHILADGMQDSIPSAVSAVDTSGDGLVDRIYVGDLGGRVWRVDMVAGNASNTWTASLLADLGRRADGSAAGGVNDRRFFHAPDVVQSSMLVQQGDALAETVKFHAVLIGSGDRANPTHNTPNNWFFMIRDTSFGVLETAADTAYDMDDLHDVTAFSDTEAVVPTDSAGWRLQLQTTGEKSLASSLTVGNTVFFTTYIPAGAVASDVCGPAEGGGRLYAVSLKNAAPRFNRDEPVGDGPYEPSERWIDLRAGGIPAEAQFISGGGGSGEEGVVLVGVETFAYSATSRWRTFWYLEEDQVQ
jgi:type IV pilus assembly protein PilY1